MKLKEAIDLVDRLKPNQYEFEQKVSWLSNLDGMIFREVIQTHTGAHIHHFAGYDDAPPDTPLLVPFPYDEDVYNYFLQSRIDRENGETVKYNQSVSLYNSAYKAYADWYNRTHLPLPVRTQFKF